MKILVTGANGLLGQKLVGLLSSNTENEIIATGKGIQRIPPGGFSYLDVDLTNKNDVDQLITQTKPDSIIHCAAMTQVDICETNRDACWEINVAATAHLLKAAEPTNAYFQYISTDFIFNGENGPYAEEDTTNPVNYYGESKLEAERLVLASSLSTSIIRTVLVYGVGYDLSRSNLVLWVKKSLESGKAIKVVNDQVRTPTLVEDLAIGCQKVLEIQATGVFHISGAQTFTPYEIALEVADFFHLDKKLITPVTASTFKEVGKRPPKTGFVIEKAKKMIGFAPKDLKQGLAIISNQLGQSSPV
ncbi:MAG: NAD(P)-dependent oxidoreductase [Cyclobacteriaceae bacterium]